MNNADQSQISTHNIKINILKPFLFTIIYFQFFFFKEIKEFMVRFWPVESAGQISDPTLRLVFGY